MDELIKTFHIEFSLLLAQMINFTIVLLILYKFAYGPILKILNERTRKIEKGLLDSEEAGRKLVEIAQKETEILVNAKKEAQKIIKKSQEDAMRNSENILLQTKKLNQKMIEDAKDEIEREKRTVISEIKAEIGNLVIMATEKIIFEKIDLKKDEELIEKFIK